MIDWDLGTFETIAPQLLPAARVAVERADPQAGTHVVDVGCGSGNAALLAAQRPGVMVTGVDPAPRLLQVARDSAAARELEATFVVGTAAELPLPDGVADVVLSVFGVIFAPDPAAATKEIARVTAPDGRIVLTAWLPDGPLDELAKAIGKFMGGPGEPLFSWHDIDTVRSLLAPHGFTVTAEQATLAFTADSVDDYWQNQMLAHPMGVASRPMLDQRGLMPEFEATVRSTLQAVNTDPTAFQLSADYLVITATRT